MLKNAQGWKYYKELETAKKAGKKMLNIFLSLLAVFLFLSFVYLLNNALNNINL
jgi:hypothetical protein